MFKHLKRLSSSPICAQNAYMQPLSTLMRRAIITTSTIPNHDFKMEVSKCITKCGWVGQTNETCMSAPISTQNTRRRVDTMQSLGKLSFTREGSSPMQSYLTTASSSSSLPSAFSGNLNRSSNLRMMSQNKRESKGMTAPRKSVNKSKSSEGDEESAAKRVKSPEQKEKRKLEHDAREKQKKETRKAQVASRGVGATGGESKPLTAAEKKRMQLQAKIDKLHIVE